MMKRMWLILMALTLTLGLVAGCSCTTEPTPTPTPMATPGTSPSAVPDVTNAPNSTDNGTLGDAAMTIPNFLVGTVVALEELPETIRAAIDREYPEANIQSITHAEYEGNQAYSVTLMDREGTNRSFYVGPNGSILSNMVGGPETGTDPAVSPAGSPEQSPEASPKASPKQ